MSNSKCNPRGDTVILLERFTVVYNWLAKPFTVCAIWSFCSLVQFDLDIFTTNLQLALKRLLMSEMKTVHGLALIGFRTTGSSGVQVSQHVADWKCTRHFEGIQRSSLNGI